MSLSHASLAPYWDLDKSLKWTPLKNFDDRESNLHFPLSEINWKHMNLFFILFRKKIVIFLPLIHILRYSEHIQNYVL